MVHVTEFEVRDYECDIQGIVNNARYIHYLEHARHKALESKNIDFAAMHDQGLDLVVTETQLKYLGSLRPKDYFRVETEITDNGKLKLIFTQKIFCEDHLILDSITTGVCLDRSLGKPVKIEKILS